VLSHRRSKRSHWRESEDLLLRDHTNPMRNFADLIWSRFTDKLIINWQNFARVQLQLKFSFTV